MADPMSRLATRHAIACLIAVTLCVLPGWLIYLEGGFAEASPGGPGRLLVLSFCAERSVVAEPLPSK